MARSRSRAALWLAARLTAAALACAAGGAAGQPVRCLADVQAGAAGELGYRPRGDVRCEGALQRYVSSATSIDLIGYQRGAQDVTRLSEAALRLAVLAPSTTDPVTLRALVLTSRSRYQMDSAAVDVTRPFDWPLGLLRQAAVAQPDGQSLMRNLGIVACTNRCQDRPDTIYWPVEILGSGASVAGPLTLRLRAGVRAESVAIRLEPVAGGAPTLLNPSRGLPPTSAPIALPPDLPVGPYRLTVTGRDAETREPLGALQATIYVPAQKP